MAWQPNTAGRKHNGWKVLLTGMCHLWLASAGHKDMHYKGQNCCQPIKEQPFPVISENQRLTETKITEIELSQTKDHQTNWAKVIILWGAFVALYKKPLKTSKRFCQLGGLPFWSPSFQTSQKLRLLSRSLSDCKSLTPLIQVSQVVSNSQPCH